MWILVIAAVIEAAHVGYYFGRMRGWREGREFEQHWRSGHGR